jgi:D-alanyl-D-alanine carboxypeptidase/D-alanyl-D-alanine-endopeptidase (penicillin-binding protein 4)
MLCAGIASLAAPSLAAAPLISPFPNLRPNTIKGKTVPPVRGFSDILKSADLSGEKSIVLVDLETGAILDAAGSASLLPPASVTKSITTLYALSHLGATRRFTTQILINGPIEKGFVQGDLILAGGGDPHLDSDGLAELIDQLSGRGIKGITGQFLVYDGALPYAAVIDDEQPEHLGYNPSVSGMNLNFNRVFFQWAKRGNGFSLTLTARANNNRPEVSGIRAAVVNRDGPVYQFAQVGRFGRWTIARSAMGNAGSRWLPVRNPADYAGEVFRLIAKKSDLVLPNAKVIAEEPEGEMVAAIQSAQLRYMLRAMLKYSTNLTAEVTGLAATASKNPATDLRASGRTMTDWVRQTYDVTDVVFEDHSGLGDDSRVSANSMIKILKKDGWYGPLRPLLKTIPVKDDPFQQPIPKEALVVAKTGTLNFASALSGYIKGANGRQMAFAIFTADQGVRAKIKDADRESPLGGAQWDKKAKAMQADLLRRWILEYGTNDDV